MTTASNTLAQLEGLWEGAEKAQPQTGDTYIRRAVGDEISYEVGVAEQPILSHDHRIIERAKSKAKPRVVMASWVRDPDKREAYTLQPDGEWESLYYAVEADDLVDPVPLVELPSHEELAQALLKVGLDHDLEWPGADALADALLELLRGGRKA